MSKNNLLKIIDYYGIKNQLKKLNEEVYELQEAILLNDNIDHIAEEFTDVNVVLGQLFYYFNLSDYDVKEIGKFKIERQLKRIKNEKE